jgi:prepilin peptidase CpaA
MLLLINTLVLLLSALYLDLRYQRIPNKLCLFAFVVALVLQGVTSQWHGIAQALLGAGLALLLLLPAYALRWLGAGDVKLMIAVGAFSGPEILWWSVIYGIMFGTISSLILAFYKVGWAGMKKRMKRHFVHAGINADVKTDVDSEINGQTQALQVPYAPALASGWLMACYLDPKIFLIVEKFTQQLVN